RRGVRATLAPTRLAVRLTPALGRHGRGPVPALVRGDQARAGRLRHPARSRLSPAPPGPPRNLASAGRRRLLSVSNAPRPPAASVPASRLGRIRESAALARLAASRGRADPKARTRPLAPRRPLPAHDRCPGPVVPGPYRAGGKTPA